MVKIIQFPKERCALRAHPNEDDRRTSALSDIAAAQVRSVKQLEELLATLETVGDLLPLADSPDAPSRKISHSRAAAINRAREVLRDLRCEFQARNENIIARNHN